MSLPKLLMVFFILFYLQNLRYMVLMKLAAYGVDEIFLYYYIDFYHQNRKQSVQVNNINSDLLSQASNKELKLGQFYLI